MKQPMAVGIYGRDLKRYLKYLLNGVFQVDDGGEKCDYANVP